MPTMLDTYVVTEGNEEAFNAIMGITQPQETPQNLFIYGPKGSGKTSFMRTRAVEKDLLSTKRCKIHAATEMLAVLKLDAADFYFEEIGSVDVLLVDEFDGFVNEPEIGPMFCKLMLQERARLGLDTIISSERPLGSYDLSAFGENIKAFREIEIKPLDKGHYPELARKLSLYFARGSNAPVLCDDACRFIGLEFAKELIDVENATQYLMQAAGFEDGCIITAEMAKKALQ